MKLRSIVASLFLTITVSSCATSSNVAEKSNSAVNTAIASAVKAQKAASKVGYEWRDTGKMIKAAKKLSADGKSEEAISLANKAKNQAIVALEQHKIEVARYAKNH